MRTLALILATGLGIGGPLSTTAATFAVNSLGDGVDAAPGDGVCATLAGACTLRAAVQESNVLPGADRVDLAVGVHELTINGVNEDAAASGDLDVTGDLTIAGINAYLAVVDANAVDRVLDQITTGDVLTLRDLTLRGGSVDGDGGGLRHAGGVVAERIIVTGNRVSGAGGGIVSVGPDEGKPELALTDSIVSLNQADGGGGGISTDAVPLVIDRAVIIANVAGACGGLGVDAKGVPSLIRRSIIYGNRAAIAGGGACIVENVHVEQSWIGHNLASPGWGVRPIAEGAVINDGGGIISRGPSSTIVNSTIEGNLAYRGGGLFGLREDSRITLTHVTMARNAAVRPQDGGGGVYEDKDAEITLENMVLAENQSDNCSGVGGDAGAGNAPNLSDDATCSGALHADAKLGSLGNYGGPTQTIPPLAGSPAFNGAQNLGILVDQRGVSRPQLGGFDLGAVEKQRLVLPEDYGGGFAPTAHRCDLDRNGRIDVSDLHRLIASFPPFGGSFRGDADGALAGCVAACTHAGCTPAALIRKPQARALRRRGRCPAC